MSIVTGTMADIYPEVRQLKPDETELLIESAKSFFKEGDLPGGLDPEVFCKNWATIIESGKGAVFVFFEDGKLVGSFGGVLAPHLCSNKLMAVECFWYVLPEYRGHGIGLYYNFFRWAKEKGAKLFSLIHMNNLHPESMKKLYQRLGYRAIETNYLMELE